VAEVLAFFAGLPPCLIGLEACATAHHWARAELTDIERATMTAPMRHSDLYFMLRYHLDQIRSRLIEASHEIAMTQNKQPINGKPTVSE
jgi:hypothetical protein